MVATNHARGGDGCLPDRAGVNQGADNSPKAPFIRPIHEL